MSANATWKDEVRTGYTTLGFKDWIREKNKVGLFLPANAIGDEVKKDLEVKLGGDHGVSIKVVAIVILSVAALAITIHYYRKK